MKSTTTRTNGAFARGVLRRRIVIAERLIRKYEPRSSDDYAHLVALLRKDIGKTHRQLAL
jgi:hypothetical protein